MKKILNALKTDFFKVSAWTGLATVIRMGTNLGVSKILAIFVGPAGFALVGQLQNGLAIFRALSTGSISNGVTKYIAEHKNVQEEYHKYLSVGLRLVTYCALVISFFLLLFSKSLSIYLFGKSGYTSIIVYFAVSLPLFSFNTILLAIINGLKEFKIFIVASIAGSIFSFFLTLILVYAFNLYGALLAFATGQSLVFFVTVYMIRERIFSFILIALQNKPSWNYYKSYLHYTIMALLSAIIVPIVEITIRGSIIDTISLEDAGIWEGLNKISTTYLGVITMSLSVYFLPRISEIKEKKIWQKEVKKTLMMILPIVLLMGVSLYLLRHYVILVIFTKDFLSMKTLFIPQIIGDVFKVMGWVLGFVMLAKTMTKTFIITEILVSILRVVSSLSFIQYFGLIGAPYAYALTYIIYYFVLFFLILKK